LTTVRRARGPRRARKWIELKGGPTNIAPAGQASTGLLTGGVELVGSTLTLILFQLTMRPATDETAEDSALLEYGITMVNADAQSAGALPDPSGPDQVPWLMRDHAVIVKATADDQQSMVYRQYILHGQRVIRDAQTSMVFVIDSTAITAAMDAIYHITGRILLLLP